MADHNKDELYVVTEQNVYGDMTDVADMSKRKLKPEEQVDDIEALIATSVERNRSVK